MLSWGSAFPGKRFHPTVYQSADVTFYVPCFNGAATIRQGLESVLHQTTPPARVIVVDDGSDPPVVLPDRAVEIIRHERNQGLGAARNTAMKLCTTPLLASIDADVALQSDWLEICLRQLNSRRAAGVGGRLVELHQHTLGDRWRAAHMDQSWGDEVVFNPKFLYGANCLYCVEALRAVGGYDPRLRTNDEDRTLANALMEKGYVLWYTPDAIANHLRQDTCRTVLHSYWRWHYVKGLLNGDFTHPEGIIGRIEIVDFGIYRFRRYLDETAARPAFLPLDALIPWVFASNDLRLFRECTGRSTPQLLCPALTNPMTASTADAVRHLIADLDYADGERRHELWYDDYIRAFLSCLQYNNWYEESAKLDFSPIITARS